MHVHVRHARLNKYSQEAAPNENGPHVLHSIMTQRRSNKVITEDEVLVSAPTNDIRMRSGAVQVDLKGGLLSG